MDKNQRLELDTADNWHYLQEEAPCAADNALCGHRLAMIRPVDNTGGKGDHVPPEACSCGLPKRWFGQAGQGITPKCDFVTEQ
jgi:hypothetical protein